MNKEWINKVVYRFAPVAGELTLAAFAAVIGVYALLRVIF